MERWKIERKTKREKKKKKKICAWEECKKEERAKDYHLREDK